MPEPSATLAPPATITPQREPTGELPLTGFAGLSIERAGPRLHSWESRPGQQAARIPAGLRIPHDSDPAPQPHRLIGMCAWAAVLGLFGLAAGARALLRIMTSLVPAWFEPAMVATGLLGIALTVAAFTAIHRPRLPWLLLAAASATLVGNVLFL